MNIFSLINNLYTNKKCDWIMSIDDAEIQPFVIQRWLAMNDAIRVQTRWLDKYVFHLTPKMYLSLAWSILPKTPKAPFVRYIKQLQDSEEYDFILSKFRKQFMLSDNDFNANRDRIVNTMKEDMPAWFRYYGIPKRYWTQYHLNFKQIKESDNPNQVGQKGLEAWGM